MRTVVPPRNHYSFTAVVRALALTLKIGNNFLMKRPLHRGYARFTYKPDFKHKSACYPYTTALSRWSCARTVRVLRTLYGWRFSNPRMHAPTIYSDRRSP